MRPCLSTVVSAVIFVCLTNLCCYCGFRSVADKTVKLFKIHERRTMAANGFNVTRGENGGRTVSSTLRLPSLEPSEDAVCATARRVFANAHAYHINSVSVNSDGETFLSADDLRINLWSLENAKLSFTLVDIKPEHMEELTEVITAACFHPQHCNMFTYSTSRGAVKLGDMRASALCDTHAKRKTLACSSLVLALSITRPRSVHRSSMSCPSHDFLRHLCVQCLKTTRRTQLASPIFPKSQLA